MNISWRIALLLTALCLISESTNAQVLDSLSFEGENSSRLTINGNTSVKGFACILEQEFTGDTLDVPTLDADTLFYLDNASITVESNSFNCGIKKVTKDFKKTLKAKKHPFITIDYEDILYDRTNEIELEEIDLSSNVNITIAEVTRDYNIDFEFVNLASNVISFVGKQPINMRDFNLKPPSPLLGLIKVDEVVNVDFFLHLRFKED